MTLSNDSLLSSTSHDMPLIEEIEDNEAGPSRSGPSLSVVLKELAARLALPEELLTSFMSGDIRECTQVDLPDHLADEAMAIYQSHALNTLEQIETKVQTSGWDMLELEEPGEIVYGVTRLYGEDPFTSATIRDRIDRKWSIIGTSDNRYRGAHGSKCYRPLPPPEPNSETLFESPSFNQSSQLEGPISSGRRSRRPSRLPRYFSSAFQIAIRMGML